MVRRTQSPVELGTSVPAEWDMDPDPGSGHRFPTQNDHFNPVPTPLPSDSLARICIIREGDYPWDPRVRNEVEALVAANHAVDVICLRRPGQPAREWAQYLIQYALFLIAAGTLVSGRHLRRRYDLIQVNSMPDTLVFAALIPKLLGARVLFDLHECMPEFVASKFRVPLNHRAVRLVGFGEQASIRFADFAITPTAQQRDAFVGRGADPAKIAVIMNTHGLMHRAPAASTPLPCPLPNAGEETTFLLVCHGTIEERYGLDTLVRATALLRHEIPELRVAIYGDGSYRPTIASLIERLGLSDRVFLSQGFVPFDELLAAIARAQAGVVAMKRDAFRDLTLCNKMFDFIGMGKAAIVSRTRSVEEYFGDSCFEMFTADDPQDLARAIRRLHADPSRRQALAGRARSVSDHYAWPGQRRAYQAIVDSLAAGERLPAAEHWIRIGEPRAVVH